ncbi:MAG: hypothetical protein K0S63_495, partial [Gammaproteobacteria bacterium]|nr:hypothetical protein [Gammaproteobacteria bacterium]
QNYEISPTIDFFNTYLVFRGHHMHTVITQQESENSVTKKVAYGIYILYVLPGLPIVGVIFAYVFEKDAKTILKSHYQYLIRSFWIGILYTVVSLVLCPFIIGIALLVLSGIWWIIRMARGLRSLLYNEAIINPTSWIF